jgi:hypothetical protein
MRLPPLGVGLVGVGLGARTGFLKRTGKLRRKSTDLFIQNPYFFTAGETFFEKVRILNKRLDFE